MAQLFTRTKADRSTAAHSIEILRDPKLQQKIAKLAYQFYEKRGKVSGHELEDWFRAEQIVLEKIKAEGPDKIRRSGC